MAASDYRPDIDGLRAVAVLLVVLYHFGLGPDGGFVGVDVFFVISGYLITGIVRADLGRGTFSFADFYARRARRILPALVAVCLTSLVAGWFLLLPSDLASLGGQVSAAVLGFANVFFWLNTGYFDQSAELLPLLHTWSLGVEEQFYLAWPMALLLLSRWQRLSALRGWLIGGAALCASLGLAQWTVAADPMAAFYLPFTRAWELGLGAAVTYVPTIAGARRAQAASLAGFGMILVAGLVYSSETEFPGVAALLPCLGASLLLWPTRKRSLVAGLLGIWPAVWIGKISYSLYLWHWPILVFAKHYNHGESISRGVGLALLIITVALSALCWKFVEQPFRRSRFGWRTSGLAAGFAGLLGLCVALQAGFPGRLSDAGQFIASFREYSRPAEAPGGCLLGDLTSQPGCITPERRPSVLLIGDSHARHFMHAFIDTFPGTYLSAVTSSQCRPVLHTIGRENCVRVMQRAYQELIPGQHYDAIIVSARWRNGQSDQLAESIDYLQRFTDRVIIFGQTVEYPAALPDLLLADEISRAPIDMSGEPQGTARLRALNDNIETAVLAAGAEFYDPLDAICANGVCQKTTVGGVPIESDYGHFTLEGSALVLERFKAVGLDFGSLPAN